LPTPFWGSHLALWGFWGNKKPTQRRAWSRKSSLRVHTDRPRTAALNTGIPATFVVYVLLQRIGNGTAVVAQIANRVGINVFLLWVGNQTTIISGIDITIAVIIGIGKHSGKYACSVTVIGYPISISIRLSIQADVRVEILRVGYTIAVRFHHCYTVSTSHRDGPQ
jgi:hypothetical protein